MTKINIQDYNIEESPCTLAYLLLIMLSGVYGYAILATEDEQHDEWIVVIDNNDRELFRIGGGGVFGTLLLSVLTRFGDQINGDDEEDDDDNYNPWNYLT